MKREGNLIFGTVLIGVAILVIVEASFFPKFVVSGKKLPGPAFFPTILGIILVISGFYEIIMALLEKRFFRLSKPFSNYLKDWGIQNVLILLLMLIIYVPIIKFLGFILGTFIISSLLMVRLKTGWIRSVVVSIALIVVIVLLFEKVFKIPLPEGVFGIKL